MHQQPPKTPLLDSTSAANGAHVDSDSGFTAYPGRGTGPTLVR